MKRVIAICALLALAAAGAALATSVGQAANGPLVSTKLPGVPKVPQPQSGGKVVFQGVMVAASSVGPGGILVGINVGCTGATNWSTNLNLVNATGGNQSFHHQTVTGKISGNRGKGSVNYRGKVPATGWAAVLSNTFCWSGSHKEMGVGYRDLVYCAVAGTAKGRCQTAQPTSYKP